MKISSLLLALLLLSPTAAAQHQSVPDPSASITGLTTSAIRGTEVTVRPDYFSRSSETITSVQTLSNEEIRRLPGGFGSLYGEWSEVPTPPGWAEECRADGAGKEAERTYP